MSTEVREGLCYRRNPASQRTGKWKSHASGYSFLICQPKMGIGSRLYASSDPSDDARCILQICPFRSGSPCDLVALREFWKSEKPSVRGTCSDMSLLHAYMVLRFRGGKQVGKVMVYNTWSVTHKVYNRNILWRNVNTDEAHIHIMMKKREFLFACLAFLVV